MDHYKKHIFPWKIDGLFNLVVAQWGQRELITVGIGIEVAVVSPKICGQFGIIGRACLEKTSQYTGLPISGLKKHARVFILAYLHALPPLAINRIILLPPFVLTAVFGPGIKMLFG